jgi:hypothetical protein
MQARNKDEFKPVSMQTIYVFGYDCFHPRGGFQDFKGRFETVGEAKAFIAVESAKTSGIIGSWEDLEILEITEQEIRIIAAGKSVSEYLQEGKPQEQEADQGEDQEGVKRRAWLENHIKRVST